MFGDIILIFLDCHRRALASSVVCIFNRYRTYKIGRLLILIIIWEECCSQGFPTFRKGRGASKDWHLLKFFNFALGFICLSLCKVYTVWKLVNILGYPTLWDSFEMMNS